LSIRKLNCVPEAFFVGVGEDEFPGLAAVGGFVEAAKGAFAAGHDDGSFGVEGLDAAEVEVVGIGQGRSGAALPVFAVVGGAEDGALSSGGPRDSPSHVGDAAEVGGCVRLFYLPLGIRTAQPCKQKRNGECEPKHTEVV
jgi:hypothetical protein